jgi:LPS O-antigen subunit length determinant protein (WzzB/FepE family)
MDEREPELIDYLAVLWRWRGLVVGGTLAGLLAAGLVTWQQPRIYRVVATMETGDVSEQEAERLVTRLNVGGFAEPGEAPSAAAQGGGRLSAEYRKPLVVQLSMETTTPAAAAGRVERTAGRAIEELNRLVGVQHGETEAALSIVQGEIEHLRGVKTMKERRAEALRRSVERLERARADASRRSDDAVMALVFIRLSDELDARQYSLAEVERELADDLPRKLQNLSRQAEVASRKVAAIRRPRLIAPPEIPATPVRPRPKLNMAVGFVAGLLGSVLLALFTEYMRVSWARRAERAS